MTQDEIITKISDKFESKALAQAAFGAVVAAFADCLKAGIRAQGMKLTAPLQRPLSSRRQRAHSKYVKSMISIA